MTQSLRIASFIGLMVLGMLVLAACGPDASSSSSSTSTTTATQAPTPTSVASARKYPTPTLTPSTSTTTSVPLGVKQVIVAGKSETILTNAQGMTLYYFKSDTKTTSACTGSCSQTWPSVLSQSAPSLTASIPVKFSERTTPNGSQLQYNDHFLYTYVGDSAPGQTNGQGIGGEWFVAVIG